jgi:undecaprenyl-diphosphatase
LKGAEFVLEIIKYILLGIVQGITEIFPISSSGHLAIVSHLFGFDTSNLVVFLMITNTGSFLAILLFFRKDIADYVSGGFKFVFKKEMHRKEDFNYLLKLLISVIPVGIAGLLFRNVLPNDLLSVGFALIVTGMLLLFIYKMRDIQWKSDITWKNAIIIGLFQMFALFPGISRSGITISGGLSERIELKKVLKFSFLSYIVISIPVSVLGFLEALSVSESIHVIGYVLSFVMSFVFSFLAVKVLYQYVKVKNLIYFSIYCLCVGTLAISLYFFN